MTPDLRRYPFPRLPGVQSGYGRSAPGHLPAPFGQAPAAPLRVPMTGKVTSPTPPVAATAVTAPLAAFTPAANSTLYAIACLRRSAVSMNQPPTCVDDQGGTWVLAIPVTTFQDGGNPTLRIAIWRRDIGASPVPMIVTMGQSDTTQLVVHMVQVLGGGDITFSGSAIDLAGDPAPSLPVAPVSSSAALAAVCIVSSGNGAWTNATGLSSGSVVSGMRGAVAVADTNPAQTIIYTSSNTRSLGVIVEIPSAILA